MSGFFGSKFSMELADSASIDAFGRLRIANALNLFASKQIYDERPLFWSTKSVNGASVVYNSVAANSALNVTSTVGSKAIRQTKQRFNYQPGSSLQFIHSFCFNTTPDGVRKRVGYFDDDNGIYLELYNGVLSVNIRSKASGVVVNNSIPQSSWNLDKLNGAGASGITLDITKVQILAIDMQWLGVGRVRIGFVINGITYYVHHFLHANKITTVYMSNPNLPIRAEIENVSSISSSSLNSICSSINITSTERTGVYFQADRGISELGSVGNSICPLISLRLDASKPGITVFPKTVDILCTSSNANFRWVLILNPTVAGVDAASWTTVNSGSIQYDVSRTISNTLTGGYVMASGYASQKAAVAIDLGNTMIALGTTVDGVSDQFVLGVQKIGAGTDTFIGGISWIQYE
ncbi:MAG: hypothetical protein LC122_13990 [Chitinophagales bacterium]|nr:hypothetical protein [Chitinophagales bacterium]